MDSSRFPECGSLYCVKLMKWELCFPESSSLYCSQRELTKRDSVWNQTQSSSHYSPKVFMVRCGARQTQGHHEPPNPTDT